MSEAIGHQNMFDPQKKSMMLFNKSCVPFVGGIIVPNLNTGNTTQ